MNALKANPPVSHAPSVATAEWFSWPGTRAVFACLNRDGFEARAVGGAVRDALLGRTVVEVDFATTARPDDIVRLAQAAGIQAVPTGIAHGTVTLIADGVPFEVTTLRRDIATDGRHATVAFGDDWDEDARRRDLTMNALYTDAQGRVYDPLGGLSDLSAGRVRFAGDPAARIQEDYLRILRFFRFSADYAAGAFDAGGVAASIAGRSGLLKLSRERVRMELLRILVACRAGEAIGILDESGILLLLLGGVTRRARFERLCRIESALQLAPDPTFRLAALGLFIEEDALRLGERLRLSSREAKDLLDLSAPGPAVHAGERNVQLEALLYRLGKRLYLGRLLLAWAGSNAAPADADWHAAAGLTASWQRPDFPLGGADLIGLGWKPGPAMGAALKELEEQWIASAFSWDRETLLGLARKMAGASA